MPARHVLLAVAIAVVWGVNFVVIHVGSQTSRRCCSSRCGSPSSRSPRCCSCAARTWSLRWLAGVGVFLCLGQFALLFVAMDQGLPAGLASLVLQAQVLFTIALAVVFLGERPRPLQIAGGAGRARRHRGDRRRPRRQRAARRARAEHRRGRVVGRGEHLHPQGAGVRAVGLLVWASLIPPLPLAALSLSLGEGAPTVGVGGIFAVLYVVVGATFFGFGSWAWLMRRHPASRVVPFALLVPPVGIATAWIALGEQPGAAELIGAVVVLAGLAITTSAVTTSSLRGTLRAWLPLSSARTTSSQRSPA
jgi:O-acetylserine/cysteine efflux transporter